LEEISQNFQRETLGRGRELICWGFWGTKTSPRKNLAPKQLFRKFIIYQIVGLFKKLGGSQVPSY